MLKGWEWANMETFVAGNSSEEFLPDCHRKTLALGRQRREVLVPWEAAILWDLSQFQTVNSSLLGDGSFADRLVNHHRVKTGPHHRVQDRSKEIAPPALASVSPWGHLTGSLPGTGSWAHCLKPEWRLPKAGDKGWLSQTAGNGFLLASRMVFSPLEACFPPAETGKENAAEMPTYDPANFANASPYLFLGSDCFCFFNFLVHCLS